MKRRSFLRRCALTGVALGLAGRSVPGGSQDITRSVQPRPRSVPARAKVPPPGEVAALSGPGTDAPGTLANVMYRTPAGPGSGAGNNYFSMWASGCYARNDGESGSMVFCAGGDGDYWGNEVYKFSLDTRRWTRECSRSTGLSGERIDPNFDTRWGEHLSPGGTPPPQPGVPHTYDQVEYLPPDLGGGPSGSFLFCTRTVVYRVRGFRHPHAFDLTTKAWRRGSATPGIVEYGAQNDAPTWCFDSKRGRYWGIKGGEGGHFVNRLNYLDFDPKTGLATSGYLNIPMHLTPRQLPFSRYWPTGDLMLIGGWNRAGTAFDLRACSLANASAGFHALALSGSILPLGRYGFAYCDDLDCFFIRMTAGHRQKLWKVTPPLSDPLARPWDVEEITMRGITVAPEGHGQGMWKRFMYARPLKCLTWVDDAKGAVYAYRPVGT